MKPIESTYEILGFKMLEKDIDETWIVWAIDMLIAGFDTEHLRILAGADASSNRFYLHDLAEKVLNELKLDYSDADKTLNNYALFLINKTIDGQKEVLTVLSFLCDLHRRKDYNSTYSNFYYLYYAKQELLAYDNQWYWPGADRGNIDKIIFDIFRNWQSGHNYFEVLT